MDLCNFDYSSKVVQETLTHQQRIEIIYLSIVHGQSLRFISQFVEVPFSTVRQAINEYNTSKRTNKLLTRSTKTRLIQDREEYAKIVAKRKQQIGKRRTLFQRQFIEPYDG